MSNFKQPTTCVSFFLAKLKRARHPLEPATWSIIISVWLFQVQCEMARHLCLPVRGDYSFYYKASPLSITPCIRPCPVNIKFVGFEWMLGSRSHTQTTLDAPRVSVSSAYVSQ